MSQPEIVFGWDVSSSCAAYVVFMNGKFMERDFIIFDPKSSDVERWRQFDDFAQLAIRGFVIDNDLAASDEDCGLPVQHCLEDRLMGFSKGFTNMGTLMKLGAMNAIAQFVISKPMNSGLYDDPDIWNSVVKMAPVSVKSAVKLKVPKGGDKKEEAVKLVQAKLGKDVFPVVRSKATKRSKGGKLIAGYGDMADAAICAMALMIKMAKDKVGQV
jgi:hypothetical protein